MQIRSRTTDSPLDVSQEEVQSLADFTDWEGILESGREGAVTGEMSLESLKTSALNNLALRYLGKDKEEWLEEIRRELGD